ncbi:putative 52 kDa repressor of the inhibitor of the protein kinase-like 15 [Homarus americanus]|uniref:Putative 52 kDa repressor of the inhibitor of the protein kinase-like 15 n=1 Tax=Homarus americanus TaxID=6706 RepID=A0A8J5MY87_HOMAM|nr:putative 52 kDa repressor of the inhibitor of the protein kinase-like 15 [Homarus americanus]
MCLDPLTTFLQLYPAVVCRLETITEEHASWLSDSFSDAKTFLLSITSTEFILALEMTNCGLSYLRSLKSNLQVEVKNIMEAFSKINSVMNALKEEVYDIEVAATFTGQEIITTPDKIEENYSEESGEDDDKVEEKISWATAEKCIEAVIKFVEQNHSFSLQDIMHAHMVQNNLITKKLQSRKQGDIRNYLKKAIEASSSAADAVEAASVPSTSSAADDTEVVEMNK